MSSCSAMPRNAEQRRKQIHAAEQVVVNPWRHCHSGGRPDDHRDARPGLVQRGFRSRERRTVVGEEDHPRAVVETGGGKRVEYPADCRVGGRDGSVEVGQILAHFNGIGQIVGRVDRSGVGRLVAIPRIGPVCFEEARRQQKRSAGRRSPAAIAECAPRRIRSRSSRRRTRRNPVCDGYEVSCCIPKRAECQPYSDRIWGSVRTPERYSQPWWARPTNPLLCG